MFIPVDTLLMAGTVIFALLVTGGFAGWACFYSAYRMGNGVKPKMPTQKPVVAAPPPPPGV